MNGFHRFLLAVIPLIFFEKMILLRSPVLITTRMVIAAHAMISLLWFMSLVLKRKLTKEKLDQAVRRLFLLVVYLASIAAASIFSTLPRVSLIRLSHPVIAFAYAAFFFSTFNSLLLNRTLKIFSILAIFSAIISFSILIFRWDSSIPTLPFLTDFDQTLLTHYTRMKGVVPIFGSLILTYPMLSLFWKNRKTRTIATFGYLLISIAFVAYASRGNFLIYLVGMIALSWSVFAWRRYTGQIIMLLTLLVAVQYIFSLPQQQTNLFQRFTFQKEVDKDTAASRFRFASQSLAIFQKNPLAGVGYGNYGNFAEVTYDGPVAITDPHNIVLLHLAETGVIGTIGLITMLGGLSITDLRYLFKTVKRKNKIDAINAVLLVSSFSYILINMSEPHLHSRMTVFFIIRALIAAYQDRYSTGDTVKIKV